MKTVIYSLLIVLSAAGWLTNTVVGCWAVAGSEVSFATAILFFVLITAFFGWVITHSLEELNESRRMRMLGAKPKLTMPEPIRLGPDNWKPRLVLIAPEHSENPIIALKHPDAPTDEQIEEMMADWYADYQAEWEAEYTRRASFDPESSPWDSVPEVIANDCALAAQKPFNAH